MNKLGFLMLTALVTTFAGCQSEDLEVPGGDGNVTFTVEIPGDAGSRAFGYGTSAKSLRYAVYDADNGDALAFSGSASFASGSMSTTVSLDLVNGKNYKIAFFAYYNSNGVYSFSAENKTVTVNYAQMATTTTQTRDYDCFYRLYECKVTGPISETIELTRPVAQVNWGTDDYDPVNNKFVENAYGTSLRTRVKVKAYKTLNILDGSVADEVEVYSNRAQSPVSSSYGTFPLGDQYTYLSMIYLLIPQQAPVLDISLECYRGTSTLVNTVSATNVPVERNFRTNIYGSLLTSQADYKVEKQPIFDPNDNNMHLWFGNIRQPQKNADGQYVINDAAELAGLAKMVNNGNSLAGETAILAADIDLNNRSWTPIGKKGQAFCGTFDGQNHTITNLSVNMAGKATDAAGLFGFVGTNATVKNLTVSDATINTLGTVNHSDQDGKGAAVIIGSCTNSTDISNLHAVNSTVTAHHWAGGIVGYAYCSIKDCTVTNVRIQAVPEDFGTKWDNGDKVGAICGFHGGEGNYVVEGNTATNCSLTGYRHVGSLFGYINGTSNLTVRDNHATGCTLTQDFSHNYKGLTSGELVGDVCGQVAGTCTYENNTATGVTKILPQIVADAAQLATAIANGGKVYVDGSIDVSSLGEVTITKPTNVTLYEGSTLTVNSNQINNSSELTIDGDGTLTGPDRLIINNAEGTLTINGGTFKATSSAAASPAAYCIHTEGDIVINGGDFTGGSYALNINYANLNGKKATINGGTFVSTGTYGLSIIGRASSTGEYNTVVINDGLFIGKNGGAKSDGRSDTTINGGTFFTLGAYHAFYLGAENYGALYAKATINGGNFYAGGNGYSIGANTNSSLTVNGGYVNKTTGFTPAAGHTVEAADKTITVDGTQYTLGFRIL